MNIRLSLTRSAAALFCLIGLVAQGCSVGGTGGSSPASQFSFTVPKAGSQVAGNTAQLLTLTWTAGGKPQSGQPVTFSTNLGGFIQSDGQITSTLTVDTVSDGNVDVTIISATPGAATITATATASGSNRKYSATLALTFLGPPGALTIQAASPIATNGNSVVAVVVEDSNDKPLPGVAVSFSLSPVSSGKLSAASATTDATGTASVLFSANSTIGAATVTASVTSLASKTATIQVTSNGGAPPAGTITFSPCPAKVPGSGTVSCDVILTDSTGAAVSGATVSLTTSTGTVTPASGETGANGVFAFTFAAPAVSSTSAPPTAAVKASSAVNSVAVGQTFDIALEAASFGFSKPASGSQFMENVQEPLVLAWTVSGNPVASQSVSFSTTQGELIGPDQSVASSLTEQTQSDGTATIDLLSSTSGSITVSATAIDPMSKARMSASLSLSAEGAPSNLAASAPSPIPSNGSSLITAVVTDSGGNPVSGVAVKFAMEAAGGKLSAATADTDSTGSAYSLFTPDGTATVVDVDITSGDLTAQKVEIDISPG